MAAKRRKQAWLRSGAKVAIIFCVVTAACACGGKASPGTSATSTAQTSASTDDTIATSTSDTTAEPPTSTDENPVPTTSDGPAPSPTSSGPVVLQTGDAGRPLTTTDFFQSTGDWKDDKYNITNKVGLTGMGEELANCNGDPDVLELRLAESFSKLTLNIGQANDSAVSDQIVDVQVIANGTQIDSDHVPFNRIQPLTESVKGVNALQILFTLNSTTCAKENSPSVIVVVTNAVLS